jgi:demethylmenaquinone methyltransferase / 2-methoxy-6-polyprenyl-1,4-benzoquinol methylase
MAEVRTPAKGTLPEGAHTEMDASRQVREMFTHIAPRYDLLNHLLSGQVDRLWRTRTARRLRPILNQADAMVLDLCCGTGDLAFALTHGSHARIIGADFSHAMLVRARQKSGALRSSSERKAMAGGPLPFLEADALRLPFPENSFDLIATAFGFRNLVNYEAGLREIQRVLKPGGSVAILEFTEPPTGLIGNFYRLYFRNILPRLGGLISGDSSAYTYLPRSVSRFFRPSELATQMANVGYASPKFEVWTFGTVALHTASKV